PRGSRTSASPARCLWTPSLRTAPAHEGAKLQDVGPAQTGVAAKLVGRNHGQKLFRSAVGSRCGTREGRNGQVAPDPCSSDVGGEEGAAGRPLAVDGKRRGRQPPPTPATAREATGFGTAGQRGDPGSADTDGEEASAESASTVGGKHRQPLRPLTADDVRELSDAFANTYFTEVRHQNPDPSPDRHRREQLQDWRMRERLKTVSVALVLCLNIGVDPPDVVKTDPCAKLECWVAPTPLLPQKALEAIGKNLQQQYEVWQPRARYRLALDPSVEETKKGCMNLRRNAKEERILFHYNGHGVPKPTASGELWVFNKDYTQYIPVSLYDLQTWLGSPCILVYDCSAA
ncbi:MAG: raptor N-terminal caspase like domain-containing protein, partial [Olpidium bornovanus]